MTPQTDPPTAAAPDSTPPRPALAYRPDIDGLRAIAVLLVLVFHFDLVPGGGAGFIGVDVFFVISGFLITSIVRSQLAQGRFSLGQFYLNRIRRLAPALFATLLLTVAVGALWLFPADLLELSQQVLTAQTYIANVYFWRSVNYFGLNASNVFLLHTWSLAIEEQFYLGYPLLLLLLHRRARKHAWSVLGLVALASFALNLWFVTRKPEATFYLLPTRAWELLLGALVSLVPLRTGSSRSSGDITGVLGAALIALGVVCHTDTTRFPGTFALLPVLGAGLLLLPQTGRPGFVARAFSVAPAVYIGRISYSLYLVHWPINVLAGRMLEEGYTLGWRTAMFAASFVVASAIHHGVESPVRHGRWLAGNRRLALGYAAGLLLTGVGFLVVKVSRGLPGRFPESVLQMAEHAADSTPLMPDCEALHGVPAPERMCRVGVREGAPAWLVVGDSHAWAAHQAIDGWLSHSGQTGLFAFMHACPPIRGVHLLNDNGRCHTFNEAVAQLLERADSPTNVALVSTWLQASEAKLSTSPDLRLPRADSIRLFHEQFSATVRALHARGKRIYVWEPVPGAKRNVPLALARAELTGAPADLEWSRAEYLATFDFFFQTLEANRAFVTRSLSTSRRLCQTGTCSAVIAGKPLYFDNNHIARSSSDFWRSELEAQWGGP